MGDEEEGKPVLVLQMLKEIDDLGLDGNIQRCDRFVCDDKPWVDHQTSGDSHALALTAGKLGRQLAQQVFGETHITDQAVEPFFCIA